MTEDTNFWKSRLSTLAGEPWCIRCDRTFSPEELAQLRAGLWPLDMDDRWVIWFDGESLRCWRSWTNTCIYQAALTIGEDGTGVAAVLDVLDIPGSYRRSESDAEELDRFDCVLSLVWRDDSDPVPRATMTVVDSQT